MNKIFVHYKDTPLGELTFENNLFVYRVYPQGIAIAAKKGYPIDLYRLDKNFESYRLPNSLLNFIPKESDLLFTQAKIEPSDNLFVRLQKVAKFPLATVGLYITD